MDLTPALRLTAIRHDFEIHAERTIPALRLAHLELARGARLALRGPNGSGKTTLLNIIAGLLQPTSGSVEVDGVDLFGLGQSARDRFRAARVGYLFQSFHLLGPLTVFENVLCAAHFGARFPRREQRERSRAILAQLGLDDRRDDRPAHLSIGQQQRVAAARALVNAPAIVLCDEPTASLDERTARRLLADLDAHCDKHQATLIVASHDAELASEFPQLTLEPAGEPA